jgi:hypothetical protein
MKTIYTKLILFTAISIFLITLVTNLIAFDDGIVGMTRKNGGVGCVCHGLHEPDTTVQVFITGLDSVAVGQTAYGKLHIVGGPHINGGLDIAVGHGTIDTTYLEPGLRKEIVFYTLTDSGYEITHTVPKPFVNDTCTFTFKYIAPNYAGYDTLFANGNSVNGNKMPDTLDAWNFCVDHFGADTRVRIYVPIGIEKISTVANSFSLGQNYPNPFNPSSNINFTIQKESFVKLNVYDITGKLVKTLVEQNLKAGEYKAAFDGSSLSSGVYIYRISIDDPSSSAGQSFTQTKKMVLLK